MPSPVAHLSMGCFLWYWMQGTLGTFWTEVPWRGWLLFGLFLFFSMAPDLDAVMGILTGDMGRFHNQQSHSLLVGAAATFLAAWVASGVVHQVPFKKWLLLMFSGYEIHILMDYLCYGRGVRVLWPIVPDRFPAPVELFGGFHWSYGWWHIRHVQTVAEESLFGALLLMISLLIIRLRKRRNLESPAL